MRLLSTGPLRKPGETSPVIPDYLSSDLKVLAHTGLPIMANDADQIRDFGNFIYRNLGTFPPDINLHIYAKYVESLNADRPEADRIGVSYRFRTCPPLDIDVNTPGTLVQYRTDDGMLSNIVVFETSEGIRWFHDDHPGVKVPEELETLARMENWYARQVVDIIKFSHPKVQFSKREVDDTESVDSMSVDLSTSDLSLAEGTNVDDPAYDTEVEEALPRGTLLGRRKNRDEDYDGGSGQGIDPRSGKRPYTASDA